MLIECQGIKLFIYINRINPLSLQLSLDRPVIIAKGFLKLPNLYMLIKNGETWSLDLSWTANYVLNKGNSTILVLYVYHKVLTYIWKVKIAS